jgi:hypothetical protein
MTTTTQAISGLICLNCNSSVHPGYGYCVACGSTSLGYAGHIDASGYLNDGMDSYGEQFRTGNYQAVPAGHYQPAVDTGTHPYAPAQPSYAAQAQEAYAAATGYPLSHDPAAQYAQAQTAQYPAQAQTAQYAAQAQTAQYAAQAQTAQYAAQAQTAQYAVQAQTAQYAPQAQTAQYAPQAQTAQYAPQAQTAQYAPQAQTAQYAPQAQTAQRTAQSAPVLTAQAVYNALPPAQPQGAPPPVPSFAKVVRKNKRPVKPELITERNKLRLLLARERLFLYMHWGIFVGVQVIGIHFAHRCYNDYIADEMTRIMMASTPLMYINLTGLVSLSVIKGTRKEIAKLKERLTYVLFQIEFNHLM